MDRPQGKIDLSFSLPLAASLTLSQMSSLAFPQEMYLKLDVEDKKSKENIENLILIYETRRDTISFKEYVDANKGMISRTSFKSKEILDLEGEVKVSKCRCGEGIFSIMSFNCNGFNRLARSSASHFLVFLEKHKFSLVCLQEVKLPSVESYTFPSGAAASSFEHSKPDIKKIEAAGDKDVYETVSFLSLSPKL